MKHPVSVDSKPLTASVSPLDATLMKNRGRGAQLLLTRLLLAATLNEPPEVGCPFPRDHVLPRSLLRTNTSESTSSRISQEDEELPRKTRFTKRTGPYSGKVHPPGKRRASWKAMIPFSMR